MLPTNKKLKRGFSGISVVIFSDGIKKDNEDLKGVILDEVKLWPLPQSKGGTSVAVNIAKKFRQVLGINHVDGHLAIINITALDSKGKVPEKSTKPLYDVACHNDTFPADIVVIPGGASPMKEGTLQSMWNTRDRYICLTAACKNHGNDIVCPEVIAVGVSKFTDSMITSGVLDFCVPMEEHNSIEEGAGAAAGMIAGLLWKIKHTEKNGREPGYSMKYINTREVGM